MQSRELRTTSEFMDALTAALGDACARLAGRALRANEYAKFSFTDTQVFAWPQEWSDTTCGFGGIGGQAFTSAQVVVVYDRTYSDTALVYIAGRFAYEVEKPSERFWHDVQHHRLYGAADYASQRVQGARKYTRDGWKAYGAAEEAQV